MKRLIDLQVQRCGLQHQWTWCVLSVFILCQLWISTTSAQANGVGGGGAHGRRNGGGGGANNGAGGEYDYGNGYEDYDYGEYDESKSFNKV